MSCISHERSDSKLVYDVGYQSTQEMKECLFQFYHYSNYSTTSRSSAILRQHPITRFYLIHTLSLVLLFALEVLCKVVSNVVNALCNTLAPDGVVGNFFAHLPELLSLLFVRGVPEAVEVLAGHRVDHFAPDLDADFGVEVEDGFVEFVQVDAGEAVVERPDVGEATG